MALKAIIHLLRRRGQTSFLVLGSNLKNGSVFSFKPQGTLSERMLGWCREKSRWAPQMQPRSSYFLQQQFAPVVLRASQTGPPPHTQEQHTLVQSGQVRHSNGPPQQGGRAAVLPGSLLASFLRPLCCTYPSFELTLFFFQSRRSGSEL